MKTLDQMMISGDLSDEQSRYGKMVVDAAKRAGIDPKFALAIAYKESKLNPSAVGSSGEIGVMQVMPSTAKELGYSQEDLRDPQKAIDAGVSYLKKSLSTHKNHFPSAAAGYNAGINHPFFSEDPNARKDLPSSTMQYLRDLKDLGAFQPSTGKSEEQKASELERQRKKDADTMWNQYQRSKIEQKLAQGSEDAMNLGAATAGAAIASGAGKLLHPKAAAAGQAVGQAASRMINPAPTGALPSAPVTGAPAGPVGGPAAPVGGPANASGGEKWLKNWGSIEKPGFQGGVPEAAAQYQKMKPGRGPVTGALAKRGLLTPSPVTPGVPTVPQLSIRGQAPAPTALPKPGALQQMSGAVQRGIESPVGKFAAGVAKNPVFSGALGGLGAYQSGEDALRRFSSGDPVGGAIAGLGAVGGLAMMAPHPLIKGAGYAAATISPIALYMYDKFIRDGDAPHVAAAKAGLPDVPGNMRQEPMAVAP